MKRKSPDKRTAIYEATLTLVMQQGFAALKISDVAKQAKVATGTVYIYFENKDELINSLYLELKKHSTVSYLQGYDPTMPFMAGFETIWHNYLTTTLKNPHAAAFMEQYYRSPFLREEVTAASDELLQPIFDLLERGKKEKVLKNIPTDLLAIQLNGALLELANWHHSGKITLDDQMIEAAFNMAWDSIKR